MIKMSVNSLKLLIIALPQVSNLLAVSWQKQVTFRWDCWVLILKQLYTDLSLHWGGIILMSNQPDVSLFHNDASLVEKHIQILYLFYLGRSVLEHNLYTSLLTNTSWKPASSDKDTITMEEFVVHFVDTSLKKRLKIPNG